jgi:hypothetical protein
MNQRDLSGGGRRAQRDKEFFPEMSEREVAKAKSLVIGNTIDKSGVLFKGDYKSALLSASDKREEASKRGTTKGSLSASLLVSASTASTVQLAASSERDREKERDRKPSASEGPAPTNGSSKASPTSVQTGKQSHQASFSAPIGKQVKQASSFSAPIGGSVKASTSNIPAPGGGVSKARTTAAPSNGGGKASAASTPLADPKSAISVNSSSPKSKVAKEAGTKNDVHEDGPFLWADNQIMEDEAFARHLQQLQDLEDAEESRRDAAKIAKAAEPWVEAGSNKRKLTKRVRDSVVSGGAVSEADGDQELEDMAGDGANISKSSSNKRSEVKVKGKHLSENKSEQELEDAAGQDANLLKASNSGRTPAKAINGQKHLDSGCELVQHGEAGEVSNSARARGSSKRKPVPIISADVAASRKRTLIQEAEQAEVSGHRADPAASVGEDVTSEGELTPSFRPKHHYVSKRIINRKRVVASDEDEAEKAAERDLPKEKAKLPAKIISGRPSSKQNKGERLLDSRDEGHESDDDGVINGESESGGDPVMRPAKAASRLRSTKEQRQPPTKSKWPAKRVIYPESSSESNRESGSEGDNDAAAAKASRGTRKNTVKEAHSRKHVAVVDGEDIVGGGGDCDDENEGWEGFGDGDESSTVALTSSKGRRVPAKKIKIARREGGRGRVHHDELEKSSKSKYSTIKRNPRLLPASAVSGDAAARSSLKRTRVAKGRSKRKAAASVRSGSGSGSDTFESGGKGEDKNEGWEDISDAEEVSKRKGTGSTKGQPKPAVKKAKPPAKAVSNRKATKGSKAEQRLLDSRDEGRSSASGEESGTIEGEGDDDAAASRLASHASISKRASAVKVIRSHGGERAESGADNVSMGTNTPAQVGSERGPAGKSEQEGTITLESSSGGEGGDDSIVWISSDSSNAQEADHQGGNDNGQERANSGNSDPASNRVKIASEAAIPAGPSAVIGEQVVREARKAASSVSKNIVASSAVPTDSTGQLLGPGTIVRFKNCTKTEYNGKLGKLEERQENGKWEIRLLGTSKSEPQYALAESSKFDVHISAEGVKDARKSGRVCEDVGVGEVTASSANPGVGVKRKSRRKEDEERGKLEASINIPRAKPTVSKKSEAAFKIDGRGKVTETLPAKLSEDESYQKWVRMERRTHLKKEKEAAEAAHKLKGEAEYGKGLRSTRRRQGRRSKYEAEAEEGSEDSYASDASSESNSSSMASSRSSGSGEVNSKTRSKPRSKSSSKASS